MKPREAKPFTRVWLPEALARKYPNAPREWPWQWVFPSWSLTQSAGRLWRHHLLPENLQRAMKAAVGKAGLNKRATPHTLRHSFATRLYAGAGFTWTPGREHDADLHACHAETGDRGEKSVGWIGGLGSGVQSPELRVWTRTFDIAEPLATLVGRVYSRAETRYPPSLAGTVICLSGRRARLLRSFLRPAEPAVRFPRRKPRDRPLSGPNPTAGGHP